MGAGEFGWYAYRPEGTSVPDPEPEDYTVAGDSIKFWWDYVAGPLWDANGLMPDEPAWLKRALGLSEDLIAELELWVEGMANTDLHNGPALAQMDARARQLVDRLQNELGDRFSVVYVSL